MPYKDVQFERELRSAVLLLRPQGSTLWRM